jgi:thiol:disulfide interchange protein
MSLVFKRGLTGKVYPMSLRRRTNSTLIAAAVLGVLVSAASGYAHSQAGLFKPNPHLYSETSNAATDISAAIAQARREHKRILLDFGGNWCGDCQVLDIYYHQSPNAELLAKHFIVVHVNIGHMDQNVAIAEKYNVPIKKCVPALAILDSHGKLLYAEHDKEFEHTSPSAITDFLNRWKA